MALYKLQMAWMTVVTSGIWISDMKRWLKFSRTMPSLEAKKARTWLTKCFSSAESFFQSAASLLRSTSSAAQTRGVCQERGMTLLHT